MWCVSIACAEIKESKKAEEDHKTWAVTGRGARFCCARDGELFSDSNARQSSDGRWSNAVERKKISLNIRRAKDRPTDLLVSFILIHWGLQVVRKMRNFWFCYKISEFEFEIGNFFLLSWEKKFLRNKVIVNSCNVRLFPKRQWRRLGGEAKKPNWFLNNCCRLSEKTQTIYNEFNFLCNIIKKVVPPPSADHWFYVVGVLASASISILIFIFIRAQWVLVKFRATHAEAIPKRNQTNNPRPSENSLTQRARRRFGNVPETLRTLRII